MNKEDSSDEGTVTDAVHHRLDNQAQIATTLPYECYSCLQCFNVLEDLAKHSIDNPTHSEGYIWFFSCFLKMFFSKRFFFSRQKSV